MKTLLIATFAIFGLTAHADSLLTDFAGSFVVESRVCAGDDLTCLSLRAVEMGYDTRQNQAYLKEIYADGQYHVAWITEGTVGEDHTYFAAGDDGLSVNWLHINKALVENMTLSRQVADGPVHYDYVAHGPVEITRHFHLVQVQ